MFISVKEAVRPTTNSSFRVANVKLWHNILHKPALTENLYLV
jgi:hypothetical protein